MIRSLCASFDIFFQLVPNSARTPQKYKIRKTRREGQCVTSSLKRAVVAIDTRRQYPPGARTKGKQAKGTTNKPTCSRPCSSSLSYCSVPSSSRWPSGTLAFQPDRGLLPSCETHPGVTSCGGDDDGDCPTGCWICRESWPQSHGRTRVSETKVRTERPAVTTTRRDRPGQKALRAKRDEDIATKTRAKPRGKQTEAGNEGSFARPSEKNAGGKRVDNFL